MSFWRRKKEKPVPAPKNVLVPTTIMRWAHAGTVLQQWHSWIREDALGTSWLSDDIREKVLSYPGQWVAVPKA